MELIRHSAIAGAWYPGTEKRLRDEINLMLDITKPEKKYENIFGLISPHAGYAYSGKTAAYVYNLLAGENYERAIVISPSHKEYFPGISIYKGDAYETPLGLLEVDKELKEEFVKASGSIFEGSLGHSVEEHALEIQLPFLQMVLGDIKILPMVIGDQRSNYVYELGEKLAKFKDDKTIIIASTDLSHFHNKHEAEELDKIVTDKISRFDYEGLQDALETNTCEACGGGGVVALMKAADLLGYKNAEVLNKVDTGDITGDHSGVVGYMSAVIYQ